uniref:Disks large-associated protein 5 n=2 Tax=Trichobilharzia regenti TaxID=157069 RepID=A0AA85J9N0_TRIRE|nr:unnamed protein product [Trichobilharzia regenti]
MARRIHVDEVPRTPKGKNLDTRKISADEIEFDSEITIKSSLVRECEPVDALFEEAEPSDEDDNKPKFIARKSIDLRKLRSEKDKWEAICSSPMVDSRPRRLSYSKSFSEGVLDSDDPKTPMRLPRYNDPISSASRRMSRVIINRRFSMLEMNRNPAFSGKSNSNNIMPAAKCEMQDAPEDPFTLEDKENVEPSEKIASSSSKEANNETLNTSAVDPNSVSEFRMLADMETARLLGLCGDWNCVLSEEGENMPETARDSVRAVVGKCELLLQKKLPFFKSLIEMAEKSVESCNTDDNDTPKTDLNDLLGYWTLVSNEIRLSDNAFERLRIWREDCNWSVEQYPVTPARSEIIKRRGRPPKHVKNTTTITSHPKRGKLKNSQPVNSEFVNANEVENALTSPTSDSVGIKTPKVMNDIRLIFCINSGNNIVYRFNH